MIGLKPVMTLTITPIKVYVVCIAPFIHQEMDKEGAINLISLPRNSLPLNPLTPKQTAEINYRDPVKVKVTIS